jgi:uncharacterized membrane protein HdeD (DUF308 family)
MKMNLESQIEEGERQFARTWRNMGLSGLLAVAFGVIALVWPNIGLTALLTLFGAFALVIGITTMQGAFDKALPRSSRVWLVVQGLLGIAVAVVVLVWPDLTALALLYAIGAFAIATGVMGVVGGASMLPLSHGRSLLLVLWGIVSIAFGAIMFAEPGAGALALLGLVAAFAIVSGVMQIACALELRRAGGEVKERLKATAEKTAAFPQLHTKGT